MFWNKSFYFTSGAKLTFYKNKILSSFSITNKVIPCLNKSLGIAYLLSNIFVFHKQSCSQKFLGKLLILCIHDTFALTAIQERCCKGSQNFCPNQIDHCITHLQPFKNFNLKVLYWINLNSIVLKRSHKQRSLVVNVEDNVWV